MNLLALFWEFFKLGIFSFGGGQAMLPWIYEIGQKFCGMDADEFTNLVGLSQMTPGPVGVNAATYVGYMSEGIIGSIVATLGVAIPAFILVITVSIFLKKKGESKFIQGTLEGIRPVAIGLIASAIYVMAKACFFDIDLDKESVGSIGELFSHIEIVPIIFCVIALFIIGKFKLSPIKSMGIMAALGAVVYGFGLV